MQSILKVAEKNKMIVLNNDFSIQLLDEPHSKEKVEFLRNLL